MKTDSHHHLTLIRKHVDCKGNIRHVRYWSKAIANNFSCFFTSKIVNIAKDKCSHCAMAFDIPFDGLVDSNLT